MAIGRATLAAVTLVATVIRSAYAFSSSHVSQPRFLSSARASSSISLRRLYSMGSGTTVFRQSRMLSSARSGGEPTKETLLFSNGNNDTDNENRSDDVSGSGCDENKNDVSTKTKAEIFQSNNGIDPRRKQDDRELVRKVGRNVFEIATFVFSMFTFTFGGLASIGLLLNLFGYGYQIVYDPQQTHQLIPTLEIETIQQLRQDNQFRALWNK